MSSPKRVREQAVVYLGQRDRALLENLTKATGLSRTELFRRGLWALAAQTLGKGGASAFDHLIAEAGAVEGPEDLSARADEYLYGGGYDARAVHEPRAAAPVVKSARKRSSKRARPR